jgi:hypothetical protein
MSPSVSQIDFWKETTKPAAALPNAAEGGQGAAYLSYNVLLALSVLGGFLALDHLYLRSPLTFLAKLILNIFTLGAWWLYDASQVVFNRDVVKIFGLSLPGWGPMGIGAGSLAGDVPDKKHMAFFAYGMALIFGGILGLDSFLVGDKQSGFIRLISLITVIFAPIAMFWWGLNLVKFFAKTKDVVEAKAPLVAQFISKIPIVNKLFGSTLAGVVGDRAAGIVGKVVEEATGPAIETAQGVVGVAQGVVNDVGKVANTARAAINGATATADKLLNVADKGAEVLMLGAEAADKLPGQITEQALKSALENNPSNPQLGGGANNDMLSYTLIGTFALLAVSGLVLTYRRLRQNEQPRKDDAPPEPGVLRKPNQEKPAQAP